MWIRAVVEEKLAGWMISCLDGEYERGLAESIAGVDIRATRNERFKRTAHVGHHVVFRGIHQRSSAFLEIEALIGRIYSSTMFQQAVQDFYFSVSGGVHQYGLRTPPHLVGVWTEAGAQEIFEQTNIPDLRGVKQARDEEIVPGVKENVCN